MANENEFLLHSMRMGVFLTFLYDGLRICRRAVPHAGFFVAAEDLAFWVYCGVEVFLLMHRESNGTFRWFVVLGALAGMCLYRKLVSGWLVKYASLALRWLLGAVGKALRLLWRPFGFLLGGAGRAVCRTGGRTCRFFGKCRRRIKNKLTFSVKMFKMNFKA